MNPLFRRILQIVAFILAVLVFGAVIYLVFFRPPTAPTNVNRPGNVNGLPRPGNANANRAANRNVNGALPTNISVPEQTGSTPTSVANGGPTFVETVVPDASDALTVGPEGQGLRYYDKEKGQFFQLSPDGLSRNPLSDDVYRDVDHVAWSPDGNRAILEFPDQSKILYDFDRKKQTTLPRELNDFSFSPQSDQIVSKYLNAANADDQWLVVSQPDGSQSDSVEHLGENADKVTTGWSPNNQVVAAYEKAANAEQAEIIFLGAHGENFPSAVVQGRGFTPRWSPDGRQILFSTYSADTDDNPHLYLMSGQPSNLGSGMIDLGLDTSADKCTFSHTGRTIYCAVPYYLNPGSGPQPELSAGIPDNIYKIDLVTNTSQLIARPVDKNLNQRYSAADMQLSPTEDALFFTDTTTGTIQKVQLR